MGHRKGGKAHRRAQNARKARYVAVPLPRYVERRELGEKFTGIPPRAPAPRTPGPFLAEATMELDRQRELANWMRELDRTARRVMNGKAE